MRISVSGWAAVVFLLCSLLSSNVLAAPDGAAGDVLVYERQGWIWTCDGNGKAEKRLVQGARPGVDPQGRMIAFFRPSRGDASADSSDLWVYHLERGSEALVLESIFSASSAVWSADSRSLALLVRDAESLTSLIVAQADAGALKTVLREGEGGVGYLCTLSVTPEGALLTHDMVNAYWVHPEGGVTRTVPLTKIMGSGAGMVTSSDSLAACPTDPTVLVFSHRVPGTPLFEKIMHEPNSALSLHDSWVGVGKNMRITPLEITAFDPVWSRDGRRIYFIGYKDTQASDEDLFRVLRIDRFGSGLKELVLGESVSVGARSAGAK
jgi:hypothetical protein